MKKTFRIKKLFLICFLLFLFPFNVFALGNATTSFSGNSKAYINDKIEVILLVNTNSPIVAFQGTIKYDTSKLELISQKSLAPFEISVNGTKIAGMDMTGKISINGNSKLIKLTFKTKQIGNAIISFSGNKQVGTNNTIVSTNGCSKTITITNPPSSNNNLSNLSVNVGNINFNKNTTSYNITVESNVTSVNISASAEDKDAKISGVGSRNLSYGNNKIDIVVTAPNGNKKTYYININRKDNRSSNNNLSSLKINNGDLKLSFNKNTTDYSLNVPYSVTDLKIDATPEDSKSKVSISGNKGLFSEETKKVTIKVTAENGSNKNYIINVTRGKDPNKKLSNNNYLSSLTVSTGILSPKFDKKQENYIVYLPYEQDNIDINVSVEDTKYATVKKEIPNKLTIGNNQFKFTVTAEDNTSKIYTVTVVRGKNLLTENISSNTSLKEIKIENGKLIEKLQNNKYIYHYKRNNNFKIEAFATDEKSKVTIIDNIDVINILVESESGEQVIYNLILQKTNIFNILLIFISIALIGGSYFIGYKFSNKKNK